VPFLFYQKSDGTANDRLIWVNILSLFSLVQLSISFGSFRINRLRSLAFACQPAFLPGHLPREML
jgi:hypothetical protein